MIPKRRKRFKPADLSKDLKRLKRSLRKKVDVTGLFYDLQTKRKN